MCHNLLCCLSTHRTIDTGNHYPGSSNNRRGNQSSYSAAKGTKRGAKQPSKDQQGHDGDNRMQTNRVPNDTRAKYVTLNCLNTYKTSNNNQRARKGTWQQQRCDDRSDRGQPRSHHWYRLKEKAQKAKYQRELPQSCHNTH